jgi:hypothetical protein
MSWKRGKVVLVAAVTLFSAPIFADDGIRLSIQKLPLGGVSLTWTGSIPNFDLFVSPSPASITHPSHLILVTGQRQLNDATLPPPGSVLYYLITSVGPCAPLSPAAICTGSERCYPTEDGLTSCAGPVGTGGQCSACSLDGTCSPLHSCQSVVAAAKCMKWCRIGFSTDCTFGTVCLPFSPPLYAGSQQFGACRCP